MKTLEIFWLCFGILLLAVAIFLGIREKAWYYFLLPPVAFLMYARRRKQRIRENK